jgi:hypothetical protein
MNEFGSLPLRAFSPKFGRGPFAYGMTLHKGGNVFEDIGSEVSNAGQSIANVVSDAGTTIDKAVIQPALQDPAGTIVKIAAIAAAPATGGTSLYAIPAYTATKAIAAGVPIEDVAKMTAISAAATAAGVSVADYVGTLAEFGTEIGSQQTAMLAAQNVGIGTGNVVSTAAGQLAGGAVSGTVNAAATGRDPVTGLLTGATNATIGQGVNYGVDAVGNLFTPSTVPSNIVASNTSGTTSDVGVDPTYQAWQNAINSGDIIPNRPLTQAELQAAGITTGNTGMDENLFGPTLNELQGYGGGFLGTGEDFNMGGNPNIIPGELGDIIQDAQGNIVLSSGADIQAAQSLGFDTTTLTNYAKQFGTQALRALLGSRGGTAGQGGTAGGAGTQGGLLNAGANYFLSDAARRAIQSASQQSTQQQLEATRRAEQFATFKPIGTTTAFGQSNFGFDPTTGQLTSAGYTATPQVAAQRERLFTLGAEALPTTADTTELQRQYIAQQQGLLAPSREQQFAQLRNRQYQSGTGGLATGGTVAGYTPGAGGLMQTNPEMAAYYNALAREDATLAANAPTYAQDLLNKRIASGTNLFTQAGALETMAQQPLTLGTQLGTQTATAGARTGELGLIGSRGAAQTQLYGNIGSATGQLGQLQGLLGGITPYVQQAGNYAINNWLS